MDHNSAPETTRKMSWTDRVCPHLLYFFRGFQIILSLFTLGCGIYIIFTMCNMASSAHEIKLAIMGIDSDYAGIKILQVYLVPVLHHLEGKPTRAIILSIVALWSASLVLYLFIKHRSARRSSHGPKRTSRAPHVALSVFTLFLWLVAAICSILLVVEYGIFTISIGPECKGAVAVAKDVIEAALSLNKTISDVLNIINSLTTIGYLAIVAVVATVICGTVELISCTFACCVAGRVVSRQSVQHQTQALEKTSVLITTTRAADID